MVQDSNHDDHLKNTEPAELPKFDRHKVIGRCPEVVASFGEMKVRCLLDSGSQVTTITESYFHKFFENEKLLDSSWIRLAGSNGLPINTIAMFRTCVKIQGNQINDVYVLVVSDPVDARVKQRKDLVPGIIGANVMEQLYKHPIKELSPEVSQALERYEQQLILCEQLSAETEKNKSEILGTVKTTRQHLTIPANTELSITCNTRQHIDGYTVLIEPLDTNLPHGLVLYPTLDKVRQGQVQCRLMNFSEKDVTLCKPLQIANICKCEVVTPDVDITYNEQGEAIIDIQHPQQKTDDIWSNLPFDVDMGDIRTTKQEDKVLRTLFHSHTDVFSKDRNDLGYTDDVEHHIVTTTEVPVKQPDRRIPPQAVPEVKRILTEWLKGGVIKDSASPYASQMVLVKKGSGEIRVCIDFRQLNQRTIKDAFPLPRIEECIDNLKGAKYFSSLDLTQGYLQIKVNEADQHKTAFRALGSLYEFQRLPFGLCNSPATFSRLMGRCMGDLKGQGIIIYLDDILVYSSSIAEMTTRLEAVFQRLRQFGLKLRPEKCHFFKEKVSFLGHTVSANGVETDSSKIKAVEDFPKPTTLRAVRQFLGLTSYFRRYVKGFAQIAKPLNGLLATGSTKHNKNKNITDQWTPECQDAFDALKRKLIEAPILGYPDFSEPFCLEVDASLKGFGAILSQKVAGRKIILAYASRGLRKHEKTMRNYSSMKLEFLALHWAVTYKFRDYLYGSQFIVLTDSHPLSRILKAKTTAADASKLAELADFHFEIQFRSGKSNVAADALSRNPVDDKASDSETDEDDLTINTQHELQVFIQEISHTITIPDTLISVIATSQQPDVQEIAMAEEMKLSSIPELHNTDLQKLQEEDPYISKVMSYLSKGTKPTHRQCKSDLVQVRKLVSKWEQLTMDNNILYRTITLNNERRKVLVLPQSLYSVVLKQLHDFSGHQGIERTTQLVRSRCYWTTLTTDVNNYCQKCVRCRVAKEPTPKLKTYMSHVTAVRPLEIVAMDFTQLEKSTSGIENVLVFTDVFTKYTIAIPTRDQTAKTVSRLFVRDGFKNLAYLNVYTATKAGLLKTKLSNNYVCYIK